MDATRRGFLAATGAAAAQDLAKAQDHDHNHQVVPSDPTLRVKALESLLVDKGFVDRAALDALVDTYEHKIGPRNGARVVAKSMDRSRLQAASTDQRCVSDRGIGLHRRPGRRHGGGREYVTGAQPSGLHALFLLSVASARPAARVVQIGTLSVALGHRPAWRIARVWSGASGRR